MRPTEVKLSGNFYQLLFQMHNSMITMARRMRVEKARKDFHRLKEQCAEKRIKDELALQQQMEKASVEHVEIMFLYERFMQGDCYKTVQQVEQGLAAINTKTSKLNVFKKNISTCVKGLGWSECYAPWSASGKQHAIEFLKSI